MPAEPRQSDASDTVKLVLLLGEYIHRQYHNRYHAKALNLRGMLRDAYDEVLKDVDMRHADDPFRPPTFPPPTGRREVSRCALNMQQNTCPFDVSGHPAFTVPCGKMTGLPVGMMLVGRHFEELTLIRLAQAFETSGS